jgi:O-antigen/teichoic acid export membrane protein
MATPPDTLDAPDSGRRAVRGSAVRMGGFAAGAALSVLGAALVTRHLGTDDYGRFQTVVALAALVAALTDLGVTTLGLREYSQRAGADREAFLRALLALRLVLSLAGLAATLVAAVALGYDDTMVGGAALQGAGVLLTGLATTLGVPLGAELRLGAVTALDVARQAATTAGYVVLVASGAALGAFFIVSPVVALFVLAATVPLVRGRFPLRPQLRTGGAIRAFLGAALSFGVATATGQAYIYAALILCGLVADAHQTGLFAASFRVYIIVATIPGILVTGVFPLLARAAAEGDASDRLRRQVEPLVVITAALGGAAALACALGAPAILAVVAGHAFDGAIPVLRVQGIALGLTFVIAALGFTLLARHAHRAIVVGNLLALAVSAATVLLLAPGHGARGAAWATVLGESVLAVAYAYGLRAGSPHLRFGAPRLARVALALALGAAAGVLPGLPSVPATAVGLVVYAAALLALRALPPELAPLLPAYPRRR